MLQQAAQWGLSHYAARWNTESRFYQAEGQAELEMMRKINPVALQKVSPIYDFKDPVQRQIHWFDKGLLIPKEMVDLGRATCVGSST